MAKLGRRERYARKVRKARQLSESLGNRASKATVTESLGVIYIGEGRRVDLGQHLTGNQSNRLNPDAMKSKSHTLNAYVGRSPGTGKPDKVKRDNMRRAGMGKSYATAFMAAGHESLKAPKFDNRVMVRTGTSPAHTVVTVDKKTGDKKVFKVQSAPIFKEVGRPDSVPMK